MIRGPTGEGRRPGECQHLENFQRWNHPLQDEDEEAAQDVNVSVSLRGHCMRLESRAVATDCIEDTRVLQHSYL